MVNFPAKKNFELFLVIKQDSWKWALGFAAIGFVPLVCFTLQSVMFAVAGQTLIKKLRDMLFRVTFVDPGSYL
jgi:hypothetical protein